MAPRSSLTATALAPLVADTAETFRLAVADLRAHADLQRFAAAIDGKDGPAAMSALHIEESAFSGLADALRSAYMAGGRLAVEMMPAFIGPGGSKLPMRFDGQAREVEAWLRDQSSKLVSSIVVDVRQAAQNGVERHILNGTAGRPAAVDIVGVLDGRSRRREGGVLGLTAQQEDFAARARTELSSRDVAGLRNYLARTRRDGRFDGFVTRALRAGTAVPAQAASKAVQGYKRRMLDLRADTIGRTWAGSAFQAGRHRAWVQASGEGKVAARAIERRWRSAAGDRHGGMDGSVAGLTEPFRTDRGALLLYPCDPTAPTGERANCNCDVEFRIIRRG